MYNLKNLKWPEKKGRSVFIAELLNRLHGENYTAILKNGQVLENLRATTITAEFTKVEDSGALIPICYYFLKEHGLKNMPKPSEVIFYGGEDYESLFPSSFLEKVFKPEEQKKEPEKKEMTGSGEAMKVSDKNEKTAEKVQVQKNTNDERNSGFSYEDHIMNLKALFGSERILTMVVRECCRDGLSVDEEYLNVKWCKQCRLTTLKAKWGPPKDFKN